MIFAKGSIRRKTSSVIIIASVIFSLPLLFLIYWSIERLKKQEISNAIEQISVLSQDFVKIITFDSIDNSVDTTARLDQLSQIRELYLFNTSESLQFSYHKGSTESDDITRNFSAEILFSHNSLYVRTPVTYAGTLYGHINMRLSLQGYNEKVGSLQLVGLGLISVTLLIILIVNRALNILVINRTLTLSNALLRVAQEHDYSFRLTPEYDDEISNAYIEFNQLMNELEQAYAKLNQSNRELESRVIERTQELEFAMREAKNANAAKSDFLSKMSHELRTPLNAILGFSQLLQSDINDDKQLDFINEIHMAGEHLLNLINEILDLSKIETGALRLNMEKVNVYDILESCITLVAPIAEKDEISITPEYRENAETYLNVDKIRFRQVIINLLSNAIKYNIKGGSIKVNVSENDNSITINIVDSGIGIPEQLQGNIFDAFFRAETKIEGSGIGLELTKKMVEVMNGEIGFNSEHKKGSAFWVRFPRPQDAASS